MRNSKVILCHNINLDRDYVNVLDYTENQMLELCNSNKVAESNSFSFIRQSRNRIATSFDYSIVLKANYIAFQNPDYSNKWFFAFIDDVIWKGEKNTEILFTVDSWSTWFHETIVKSCFVSREHVNDDTIGLHTVPENLDTGDPIQIYEQEDIGLSQFFWIGVMSSFNPANNEQFSGITMYNNLIYGKQIHLFNASPYENLANLVLYLLDCTHKGHIEDVSDMFIVPYSLLDLSTLVQNNGSVGGQNYSFYTMPYTDEVSKITSSVPKQYAFSDYQPKNNKALCYPYNYLLVTNNIGNQNIYKYEDFSGNNANFETQLALTIGCSGRLIPKFYRNCEYNIDESLPLAKYPTCRLDCRFIYKLANTTSS